MINASNSGVHVHTATSVLVQLFCVKCQEICTHQTGFDDYVWCQRCQTVWDVDEIPVSDMYADGVDLAWIETYLTKHDARSVSATFQTYCSECKKQTTHHISVYSSLPVCSECKYLNVTADLIKTDTSPMVRPGPNYAGTIYGNKLCIHWRDIVSIGDYYVTVSASYDRLRGRQLERADPDYGVYLSIYGWQSNVMVTPGFPTTVPNNEDYPMLFFEWDDGAAPRNPATEALVTWLVAQIQAGKIIDIGCMGSHGRTGTLLALLILEIEGGTAKEAIDKVRSRHCVECIETYRQECFIFNWNHEPSPAPEHNPTTTYKLPLDKSNSKFKYANRTEKKAAKRRRRDNRQKFREQVEEARAVAKEQGITWVTYRDNVFENPCSFWECNECAAIVKAAYVVTTFPYKRFCNNCKRMQIHQRPICLSEEGEDAS